MKKIILLFLLMLSITLLYCNDNTNIRRHNIDLSGSLGFSFGIPNIVAPIDNIYGGNIGISFGYQYTFNKYFAFGGGINGILAIMYFNYINQDKLYYLFYGSGGGALFLFTIGDLNKKIAFLFDIGGGWSLITKVGIYINGIILKLGYHSNFYSYSHLVHNITFDIGYRFSF